MASSASLEAIIDIESDRFQNLEYSEDDFRTEAGAILGEYNLNFSNPVALLQERLHDRAYLFHPYKHTTLGLLADIQDMPNHYDYSREFYDRYYRPNNSFIVVVGDFDEAELERLVGQYYAGWEESDFEPTIPVEPPQTRLRTDEVTWPNPTLPFVMFGYRVPDFSDQSIEMPALDVLSQLLFSETSPLFQKLYLEEQVVDVLTGGAVDSRDAPLFTITARVTDPARIEYVRQAIVDEIDRMKVEPVDDATLAATKSHMRYQFAMGLDNPGGIAPNLEPLPAAHGRRRDSQPRVSALRCRDGGGHHARGDRLFCRDKAYRGHPRPGGRMMVVRRAGWAAALTTVCALAVGCFGEEPVEPDTDTRVGLQYSGSPLVDDPHRV